MFSQADLLGTEARRKEDLNLYTLFEMFLSAEVPTAADRLSSFVFVPAVYQLSFFKATQTHFSLPR